MWEPGGSFWNATHVRTLLGTNFQEPQCLGGRCAAQTKRRTGPVHCGIGF
jgi:hypothetical protein